MKNYTAIGIAAAVVAALPAAANAGIVYDNGGTFGGGNEATAWVQAEDFTFGTDTAVGGAGIYIGGSGLATWDGTIEYMILGDAGGTPAGVLASGAGHNVSVTDTGLGWCCGDAYLLQFDFGSAFAAASSLTYWLGIHLSSNFDRDEIYWIATSGNATSAGHESSLGTLDNWFGNGNEHAFFLTGESAAVPEPGALGLLGLGLAGLATLRRRKLA